MMSVKALFAVSMAAIGASTLGAGAYLVTHPTVSAKAASVEGEVVPLPPTRFEFVLASTMNVGKSTAARVVTLDPVTIYGKDSVRIGAR